MMSPEPQQPRAAGIATTIQGKTTLIIGAALLALILLLSIALRLIMLDGLTQIEHDWMGTNVERVQQALDAQAADLERMTGDWAAWDDTYEYAEEPNAEYEESNLNDEMFINNEISLMIIANSARDLVLATAFDQQAGQRSTPPQAFSQQAVRSSPLFEHPTLESKKTGLLVLDDRILLISSQPILTNERTGPAHGTFIWGRLINDASMQQLSETTQLNVQIYRLDAPDALPATARAPLAQLQGGAEQVIEPLNADVIAGYALINDIEGRPVLLLQVQQSRDLYAQGERALITTGLALLAAAVGFALLILFLIRRFVTSPLTALIRRLSSIGSSGDLHQRLAVQGRDELAVLGRTIDGMLDSLDQAQQQQQRAQVEQARMQEALLREQSANLAAMSTPIIPLSEQLVIMPLIGTVDQQRSEQMITALLEGVSAHRARVAIIDITGVPELTPEVAQQLVLAAEGARLLGSRVIVTGIGTEVALSLARMGTAAQGLTTRSSLESGIAYAAALLR